VNDEFIILVDVARECIVGGDVGGVVIVRVVVSARMRNGDEMRMLTLIYDGEGE
jgi:hypothetical protein